MEFSLSFLDVLLVIISQVNAEDIGNDIIEEPIRRSLSHNVLEEYFAAV